MLLFGSFTEDEARSCLNKSSSNTKIAGEKKEMQVNSKSPAAEVSFGSFSSGPSIQFGSLKASDRSSLSNVRKENGGATRSTADNLIGRYLKENGTVSQSTNICGSRNKELNEVKSLDFTRLCVSRDENEQKTKTNTLPPQVHNGFSSKELSSNGNCSLVAGQFEEAHQRASDGPVLPIDLVPRGLINSGNLCFLNATLQALLSCSPFAQLLLELRICNILKVPFTVSFFLGCFICYVALYLFFYVVK